MKELLIYNPQPSGDNLQSQQFVHDETFYSGQTPYVYQEEYIVTKGIRKGIQRIQDIGLIPESYVAASDAVLETTSNNMLPGLTDTEGHTQFVKFRGGTSLAQQKERPQADILISQCIFGEFGSTYTLADGRVLPLTSPKTNVDAAVENINIDPRFSLYEHDALYRQTALLRNLAEDNNLYRSVTIGVPRLSYYLHAAKPYNEGHLTPNQMNGWFDAVDARYDAVVDAIKEQIPTNLACRVKAPLDEIEGLVRAAVRAGDPLHAGPLIEALRASDDMWNTALQGRTPTSAEQFRNEYAEAIEELRLPVADTGVNCRLIIKNPKDEGAFELGSKINTIASIAPAVAMYALPQVITSPQGYGLYRMPTAPTANDVSLIRKQYA